MYRSRHNPKKPPTASCFGLEGSTRVQGANRGDSGNVGGSIAMKKGSTMGGRTKTRSNPRDYLKGSGKDVISKNAPQKFVRPMVRPKKAGPPPPSEKPVMGLQTTKNFLVANAVENILAVPKKSHPMSHYMLQRKIMAKYQNIYHKLKRLLMKKKLY